MLRKILKEAGLERLIQTLEKEDISEEILQSDFDDVLHDLKIKYPTIFTVGISFRFRKLKPKFENLVIVNCDHYCNYQKADQSPIQILSNNADESDGDVNCCASADETNYITYTEVEREKYGQIQEFDPLTYRLPEITDYRLAEFLHSNEDVSKTKSLVMFNSLAKMLYKQLSSQYFTKFLPSLVWNRVFSILFETYPRIMALKIPDKIFINRRKPGVITAQDVIRQKIFNKYRHQRHKEAILNSDDLPNEKKLKITKK